MRGGGATLCETLGLYVEEQLGQRGNRNATNLRFDDGTHAGDLLVYLDNRRAAGSLVVQQVTIEPNGGNLLLPCLRRLGRIYAPLGLKRVVIESVFSEEWLEKLGAQGLEIQDSNAVLTF